MRRHAVAGLVVAAMAGRAEAAPPAALPLQFLPGDAVAGPAWGDQAAPDIEAGDGSFLVAWSDARASEGKWDIWGIRLDDAGRPLDPVAFVIDDADGSQTAPVIAWNGADWLVAWLDEGTVMAVRVSSAGAVLGPAVALGTPGPSASLATASDGTSWAVVWAGTSAGNADVRGARVAADGSVLDPGGLRILPETFFVRLGLTLAFASGRYLLAWPEWSSSTDDDIVGLRLSAALSPIDAAPFVIVATPDADRSPALASNGGSYCLAWKETDRNGWVNGITAALVNPDGIASPSLGIPVGDRRSWGESPDVAWDGSQWVVGWTALGAHAARLSADGTVLDPAGVVVAPSGDFDVREIALAGTPGGGIRAVHQDARGGRENDIGGAGLSAAGIAMPENVVALSAPSQQHAQVAWNGDGYAIAFESWTSRGCRILVHRVDAAFLPIGPEPIEVAAGDVLEPGIAWSGSRYLVTWKNRAASRIEARRLAPDLSFQDAAPIDVMAGDNPSVAAAGDMFLVTVDHSPAYWQWRDVYGQRIDGSTGSRVGGLVQLVGAFAWGSAIGTIGDRWLVAWEAHQAHDDTIYTLAHAFVARDGSTTPVGGLTMGSGWGVSGLSIASHPSTGAIAWSTTRAPSASDGEIVVARVDADGSLPDGPTGAEITQSAPREQSAPCAAWNGREFVTVFQDTRNNPDGVFAFPRSDVYGVRVDAGGGVLDAGGGFAIETDRVPETQPAVAGGGGASLVVASRLVGGTAGALRLGLRGLEASAAPVPPIGGLRVARDGRVTWDAAAAGNAYDVLRGSLRALAADGAISESSCLADDVGTPRIDDAIMPGRGEGFYYLVRADATGAAAGTYDDAPGSSQGRPRDPDAGPAACPDSP